MPRLWHSVLAHPTRGARLLPRLLLLAPAAWLGRTAYQGMPRLRRIVSDAATPGPWLLYVLLFLAPAARLGYATTATDQERESRRCHLFSMDDTRAMSDSDDTSELRDADERALVVGDIVREADGALAIIAPAGTEGCCTCEREATYIGRIVLGNIFTDAGERGRVCWFYDATGAKQAHVCLRIRAREQHEDLDDFTTQCHAAVALRDDGVFSQEVES